MRSNARAMLWMAVCLTVGSNMPADAARTQRISVGPGDIELSGRDIDDAAISADGRWVTFSHIGNIMLRDRTSGITQIVQTITNCSAFAPIHITSDGRFISVANCPLLNITVIDRNTATTTTHPVNGFNPVLSDDGRFLAFRSSETALVAGDTNNTGDIFVLDRQTAVIERVNVASDGSQANAQSDRFVMTPDGRFVAFSSDANNLVADDTNGNRDVFVRDRNTGTTSRVSVLTGGGQGPGGTTREQIDITSDGRWVGFATEGSFVPEDTDVENDAYMHDRSTGMTTRVDGSRGARGVTLSDDGRWVAFRSYDDQLVEDDRNLEEDFFVADRTSGTTTRVSVSSAGIQQIDAEDFGEVWMSGNGSAIIFPSPATNLVLGDTNDAVDLFLWDRDQPTSCGNGVVDEFEECDDANGISEDGCEPTCVYSDCVPSGTLAKASIAVTKRGGAPDDERMKLKARIRLTPGAPAFDPVHLGLGLLIEDMGGGGRRVIDLTYRTFPMWPFFEWTTNSSGTRVRYSGNYVTGIPFAFWNGLAVLQLLDQRPSRGEIALVADFRYWEFGPLLGPLRLTVVAAGRRTDATGGGCARHTFAQCGLNRSGTKFACK